MSCDITNRQTGAVKMTTAEATSDEQDLGNASDGSHRNLMAQSSSLEELLSIETGLTVCTHAKLAYLGCRFDDNKCGIGKQVSKINIIEFIIACQDRPTISTLHVLCTFIYYNFIIIFINLYLLCGVTLAH